MTQLPSWAAGYVGIPFADLGRVIQKALTPR